MSKFLSGQGKADPLSGQSRELASDLFLIIGEQAQFNVSLLHALSAIESGKGMSQPLLADLFSYAENILDRLTDLNDRIVYGDSEDDDDAG